MSRLLSLGLALATLGASHRAAAQDPVPRKWTAILMMAGTYESMEEKLAWTGSSDDVNLIVLHQGWEGGIVGYRMLPDDNPDHPAGECCPGEVLPCCSSEPLPLEEMEITPESYIADAELLYRFLSFVHTHYPAEHYLISHRGATSGVGLPLVEFANLMGRFSDLVGRKIDVVNNGFCLGGLLDWAYTLREHVDYFVGSPNWTNPPVSARWRFYAWVRELIKNPDIDSRAFASTMADLFAMETIDCGCSNPGEPWTVSAVDLSKMGALAAAHRELNCALLEDFSNYDAPFEDAAQHSAVYGSGMRNDLVYFARVLREDVGDEVLRAAAQEVITAGSDAVINFHGEPGGLFDGGDNAYGTAVIINADLEWDYTPEYYGPYQLDSSWRLVLQSNGSGVVDPVVSELTLTPDEVTLAVGESVEIEAVGVSAQYGTLCGALVDWDTSHLRGGTLVDEGNPARFKARYAGTGTLVARMGALTASAQIAVRGSGTSTPRPKKTDEGCGCGALPRDPPYSFPWASSSAGEAGVNRRACAAAGRRHWRRSPPCYGGDRTGARACAILAGRAPPRR